MRGLAMSALALLCACGASVGGSQDQNPDGGGGDDQDADPPPDDVAPLGPFGMPVVVPGASSGVGDDDGTLSHDGLELVFALVEPADNNRKHLYILTRASTQVPFAGPPTRLAFNVTGATEQTPRFSEDDLTLFFASSRDGNGLDIFSTTRAPGAAFGTAVTKLPAINDGDDDDKWYMPCDVGRFLMISSRAGNEDIFEGIGAAAPTRVAALSSAQPETGTFLTPDCLTVYFASTRGGPNRIFTSTRTAVDQPWPAPTEVTDFMPGATENQEDPWLSPDGRTFVLSSNRNGTKDVFISTR
jgi:Tol biopolymer transport system component